MATEKNIYDAILELTDQWRDCHCPSELYLDPESRTLHVFVQTGVAVPEPVQHRRWLKIFDVPPRAIHESVIYALFSIASSLEALCDCYKGAVWDGYHYIGEWECTEGIFTKPELPIAYYHTALEWFEPIENMIKKEWMHGKNAEQILAEYGGGDVSCGILEDDKALEVLEQFITRWETEETDKDNLDQEYN